MINMKQILSYDTEIKVEINHSNGTKAHWREAGMYSECFSILNTELHKSSRVPVAPSLPFFYPVTASFWKPHVFFLPPSAVLSSFNTSQGWSERCRCVWHRLFWWRGHQRHQGKVDNTMNDGCIVSKNSFTSVGLFLRFFCKMLLG